MAGQLVGGKRTGKRRCVPNPMDAIRYGACRTKNFTIRQQGGPHLWQSENIIDNFCALLKIVRTFHSGIFTTGVMWQACFDIGASSLSKHANHLSLAVVAFAATLTGCAQQPSRYAAHPGFVEDDPLRAIRAEGRARGYQLALATQCGGVPAKVQAARDSVRPSATVSAAAFDAYRAALAENYTRAMHEERMNQPQCDTARKDMTVASLFPPPPDPNRMNRRDRERYYAELAAKDALRVQAEADRIADRVVMARELQAYEAQRAALAQADAHAAAQCEYEASLATANRPYRRTLAAVFVDGIDQALTENRLNNLCRRARGIGN